jgi:hypothetical protein
MQLKELGLTRAGRMVLIILVVPYLGLGQLLAFAPAPAAGFTLPPAPQADAAALAVIVSVATLLEASRDPGAVLARHGPRAILPDPTPLPRWLPRAPPAV